MKKTYLIIAVIVTTIVASQFAGCGNKPEPVENLKQHLKAQVIDFEAFVNDSIQPLTSPDQKDLLISRFKTLRNKYKSFEWVVEYYMPAIARFVNGPPLPEVEQPEIVVLEPHGLQVMEEILLEDSIDFKALEGECILLKSYCISIKEIIEASGFSQPQLYDALKKEMFRIIVSGITGFDAPGLLTGITESSVALKSLLPVLPFLQGDKEDLKQKLQDAINYLDKAPADFNQFDRMIFIKEYANPLTQTLVKQQKEARIPFIQVYGMLQTDASTLFDKDAFDPYFQAGSTDSSVLKQKTALGEKLFYDNVLSTNTNRSCATCHRPEKAFTDGMVKNVSVGSNEDLLRNTPTLLNAALQTAMFYDLKVNSVDQQADAVIMNKDEMHGDFDLAVQRLSADNDYAAAFKQAFKTETISKDFILEAISDYIKSLVFLNSRFDKYMQGNDKALSQNEISGFNLFAGKAKCATCHFIPLFNGVVPPAFEKTESEVLGVPQTAANQKLDSDIGRYAIIDVPPYLNAFKTMSVRNAGLTAPYMHNGVYQTLEEVMDFYNKGGGAGMGLKVENQTLAPDPLNLSKKEIDDIIAFLNALNDDVPVKKY